MSAVEMLPILLGIGALIFVLSIALRGPVARMQRKAGTYQEPKISRRQEYRILALCTFGGPLVGFLALVLIESGSDAAKVAVFVLPLLFFALVLVVSLRSRSRNRERH